MILKKGITVNSIGIVTKFSKAAYVVYFSRTLGAANFGIYMYCFMVFDIVATIAQMGFGQKMNFLFGKYKHQKKERFIFRTGNYILLIGALISVVISAILYAIAPMIFSVLHVGDSYITAFRIMCYGIPFYALRNIILFSLRATFDTRPEIIIFNMVEPVMILIVGFAFLWRSPTLENLCKAFVVSYALIFFICLFIYAHKYKTDKDANNETFKFRDFFKSSLPIMGMEALNNFMGRIDLLLIGLFVSPAIVGVYGAAFEIGSMISKIKAAADPTLPSLLQKIHFENSGHNIEKWFSKAMFWTFFATLLISGFVLIDSNFFMSFFKFDPVYQPYFILAPMICFGRLLHAVFGLVDAPLYMIGHSKASFSISLVNFALNVAFFTLLIPQIGIFGAGIGFFCSSILTTWFRLYLVKKIMHVQPIHLKFFYPLLCMAAGYVLTKPWIHKFELPYYGTHILAFIVYGAAYYFAFLFLTRSKIVKRMAAR